MLFRYFRALTRLSDLEERTEALERAQKGLEIEWEDTYDKVRSILGKISKRNARQVEAEAATAEDAPGSTNGEDPGTDAFSADVRAFRRRGA